MSFQFRQIQRVRAIAKATPIEVTEIITHHRPSIDDACAIAILFFHGEKLFPAIDTAKISFWNRGDVDLLLDRYNGDSVQLLQETGKLIVGMAGSFLDEHPHEYNGQARADNECAATLTARLTGSYDDPCWRNVLRFVLQDDTGKRMDHLYLKAGQTLPNLMKAAYRVDYDNCDWSFDAAVQFIKTYHLALENGTMGLGDRPNWHIDHLVELAGQKWAAEAGDKFYEVYSESMKMSKAAEASLDSLRPIEIRGWPNLRPINILFANNDIESFQTIVFRKQPKISVVVLRRSTGNVQIFTRKGSQIDLTNTTGLLRQMELQARGEAIPQGVNLFQAGELKVCKRWCFFQPESGNDMLLNGSLTSPDTIATLLSNDHILQALTLGLKTAPTSQQAKQYNKVVPV
ncbi:MAG TPA: hypothetical protein VHQ41_03615 [Patescibacteria group bacterium]|jgi:hypothetical protein|nr:hypothetical protein [Patescibacteria group bacterium]